MSIANLKKSLRLLDRIKTLIRQYIYIQPQSFKYVKYMQMILIPSEFFAIFIASELMESQHIYGWAKVALTLFLFKLMFLMYFLYKKDVLYFIFPQLLSTYIWSSYGIMSISNNFTQNLLTVTVLTGVTAASAVFFIWIKNIYQLFATAIIAPAAIMVMLKHPDHFYIGVGLIILLVYLTIMSNDLANLLYGILTQNTKNLALINDETITKNKLHELERRYMRDVEQRKRIEKVVIESNDKIEKLIAKKLHRKKERTLDFHTLFDNLSIGILLINHRTGKTYYNKSLLQIWDIDSDSNLTINDILFAIRKKLQSDTYLGCNFPTWLENKDTEYTTIFHESDTKVININVNVFYDTGDKTTVWRFKDITHLANYNQPEKDSSYYDTLTGLPSRQSIIPIFEKYTHEAQKYGNLFAVCFIDLDDFKIVNDALGHEAGNDVLKTIGQRLSAALKESDFLCRLGGDEFLCIIGNLTYKSEVAPSLENILNIFNLPIKVQGAEHYLSASIGASFYPCDDINLNKLIMFADSAMYTAKEKGKNTFMRYQPSQSIKTEKKLQLQQMIREGIAQKEFYLDLQPIFTASSQAVSKYEVLSRWTKGISPGIYIPIAENLNLIHQLNLNDLKSCSAYIERLQKKTLNEIQLSINLSSVQINNNEQRKDIIHFVRSVPFEKGCIEFEMTETSIVDHEQAYAFIEEIHALGATVALDDFGTGFSGFKKLQQLRFDNIKIDRSFIASIGDYTDSKSIEILKNLIEIIRVMDAKVTIEGVETAEQFAFCQQHGCDFIQGFYFSRPKSIHSILSNL